MPGMIVSFPIDVVYLYLFLLFVLFPKIITMTLTSNEEAFKLSLDVKFLCSVRIFCTNRVFFVSSWQSQNVLCQQLAVVKCSVPAAGSRIMFCASSWQSSKCSVPAAGSRQSVLTEAIMCSLY